MQSSSKIAQQIGRKIKRLSEACASHLASVVIGATVLTCASVAQSAAAEPFPMQCALRDVQVLTQIEHAGESAGPSADHVAKAFFTMLEARAACAQQRIADGLGLYDGAFNASLATTARK